MKSQHVLIIADRQHNEWYRSLYSEGGLISVVTFMDVNGSIDCSQADVIILDCGINVQKGLKLLRSIKSLYSATPVIFITAISSEDIAIEAFRIGVKEFVRKPVVVQELKESIEFLLRLKRLSGEKREPLSLHISDVRNPGFTNGGDLPGNILNVVRFIEENIANEIDLETLAREASISKYHFCKIFKKHFGMAPLKYVTAKRIEMAKKLLPRGDRNVSFVAYEVGFRDLSSFNKHFKRQTGVTPSLFRSAVGKRAS